MIFLTVGTTMPFDELVEFVDQLKKAEHIKEDVLCQIGNGKYLPEACEYFRFRPGLNEYIEPASIVIGHGGTGTVLSMLNSGKKFIAVVNPRAADSHQSQFLSRMQLETDLLWTDDLSKLPDLINAAFASSHTVQKFSLPSLAADLRDFLLQSKKT